MCLGGKMDIFICWLKLLEIRVRWNCNGYVICYLYVLSKYFGNFCVNIFKYLEISYCCVRNIDNNIKGSFIFMVFIEIYIDVDIFYFLFYY